mmetsp:Transcript_43286/g.116723  ORF Transcript_43286/g.116723 Transcript_43286/m.116723 type:complete len:464 (+) Transcript_43286:3-1394(+)
MKNGGGKQARTHAMGCPHGQGLQALESPRVLRVPAHGREGARDHAREAGGRGEARGAPRPPTHELGVLPLDLELVHEPEPQALGHRRLVQVRDLRLLQAVQPLLEMPRIHDGLGLGVPVRADGSLELRGVHRHQVTLLLRVEGADVGPLHPQGGLANVRASLDDVRLYAHPAHPGLMSLGRHGAVGGAARGDGGLVVLAELVELVEQGASADEEHLVGLLPALEEHVASTHRDARHSVGADQLHGQRGNLVDEHEEGMAAQARLEDGCPQLGPQGRRQKLQSANALLLHRARPRVPGAAAVALDPEGDLLGDASLLEVSPQDPELLGLGARELPEVHQRARDPADEEREHDEREEQHHYGEAALVDVAGLDTDRCGSELSQCPMEAGGVLERDCSLVQVILEQPARAARRRGGADRKPSASNSMAHQHDAAQLLGNPEENRDPLRLDALLTRLHEMVGLGYPQ